MPVDAIVTGGAEPHTAPRNDRDLVQKRRDDLKRKLDDERQKKEEKAKKHAAKGRGLI